MSRAATRRLALRRRCRSERAHLPPHTTRRPTRLASTGQLMAQGAGLLLPRLYAVPLLHQLVADDRLAVMLAKALIDLDIANPGDWKRAGCDPTSFIRLTLERSIDAHGSSAIRRRFLLAAAISSTPCEWAERDETKPNQLFLIVEPSEASCGCATFGPTLELLERVHPQLPVTFFHLFVGALNRWIRVYDYRDAQDRAETLREWAAQESDTDLYELPSVEGAIPPCMRQTALNEGEVALLKGKNGYPLAMKLVEAALGLDRLSAQAKRPELDDDTSQQLSDCNPALPCLLAVFAEADAIAACFDEEAEGMMEATPEPNLIIPFDPTDTESVHAAFQVFSVACETIAAASGLVDLMPGNDRYLISR